MNYGKIKEISDSPDSWKDKIFITLDIDWCHDDVLIDSIELLEKYDISATWFVTHKTPLLERLKENPNFELGIHPNFNYLLEGNHANGRSPEEVVDRLLELVPEAKSVRTHSMLQSSPILDLFSEKGLTHDCNHFIPWQSEIQLKPWRLWNNILKIPHFWEDDIAISYNDNRCLTELNKNMSIKVFDFHPIHIFLNSNCLKKYDKTRSIHYFTEQLINHRVSDKIGTRTKLIKLLCHMGV